MTAMKKLESRKYVPEEVEEKARKTSVMCVVGTKIHTVDFNK